jgi:hypothetical protein
MDPLEHELADLFWSDEAGEWTAICSCRRYFTGPTEASVREWHENHVLQLTTRPAGPAAAREEA